MDDNNDIINQTPNPSGQGYYRPEVPSTNPLLRIVGALTGRKPVEYGEPQSTTNYAPMLSAMETKMGLPAGSLTKGSNMTQNGQPFMSADNAEATTKLLSPMVRTSAHPTVSPEMASAVASGDQDQINKQWTLEHPEGAPMPTQFVTMGNAAKGTKSRQDMAGAMADRVANMRLQTLLQYGGVGAAQGAAKDAYSRLSNLNRADGIYKIITDMQNGDADPRQRALFTTEVARAINPSGVLTNEALNSLASDSAKQKINDWKEWWTNKAQPTDFQGFLTPLKELVDQEKDINQGLYTNASKMGLKIISSVNPKGAKVGQDAINTNPTVNPNGAPQQLPSSPQPTRKPINTTGRVHMIRPDGSGTWMAAKDVISARAQGYQVK